MGKLQELLSRSVVQNLGLSDILSQREREAQQLGAVTALQGDVEAAQVHRQAAEKRGFMETMGAIAGGTTGFMFGGVAGASAGAKLGARGFGALSGKAPSQRASAVSGTITSGLDIASQLSAQKEQAKLLRRKQQLEEQKTISEIGKTLAETERLRSPLEKDTGLRKKILDIQASGKGVLSSSLTEQQIKGLPKSAFFTLGTGDDQVQFVKSPKALAGEQAAKFSVAKQARRGALELLSEFDKNIDLGNVLRLAGTKGAKRLPGSQKAAAKLDLITEGLGRALSGAAVPESEMKNFRNLFAVNTTDTDDAIKFKLQRSVDIVNDLENFMKFGAGIDDVTNYLDNELVKLDEIKSGVGNQETIEPTKTLQQGLTPGATPVSRTADGRVRLSDGSIIGRDEAESLFGGQ